MNQKIKDLLRLSDEPVQLYAAARIEELEQQVDDLRVMLDKKKPTAVLKRTCLLCSASMSADDREGGMVLVCSEKGFKEVEEDGFCDRYR